MCLSIKKYIKAAALKLTDIGEGGMSVLHRLPFIVHQHGILSPLATPYPTGGQGGWDVTASLNRRIKSMLSFWPMIRQKSNFNLEKK